jgi:hypothetical protein
MTSRVDRVDSVVGRLKNSLESTPSYQDRVGMVKNSGVLLDTPSHVTSFGNDDTLDSALDTTGGRTFQTSSEESFDQKPKDSPPMSEGSKGSKVVSESSEERGEKIVF